MHPACQIAWQPQRRADRTCSCQRRGLALRPADPPRTRAAATGPAAKGTSRSAARGRERRQDRWCIVLLAQRMGAAISSGGRTRTHSAKRKLRQQHLQQAVQRLELAGNPRLVLLPRRHALQAARAVRVSKSQSTGGMRPELQFCTRWGLAPVWLPPRRLWLPRWHRLLNGDGWPTRGGIAFGPHATQHS